jgi:hypothetical protein
VHNNAFNLGVLNPIRVDSVNQIIRVKILSTATYSQVLCALADVPGTNVFHDVEKL